MRRPWIKIETNTPDKPEICAIATTLRMDADAVLGKLIRLWSWVEVNQPSPNDLGVTKEFIDKLVGRKGFAAAMISAGWLVETEGRLTLKNLDRHSSGLAKIRALTAVRVAIHRKRKTKQHAPDVSKSLPKPAKALSPEPPAALQVEDADSVQSVAEPLTINDSVETEVEKAPLNDVTPLNPPVEVPQPPPSELPAPAANIATEVVEEVESPPRKRKTRQAQESADQPFLF